MKLCPACKGPVQPLDAEESLPSWFPFCSERCKMVDLGQWFSEGYKISRPAGPSDEAED